MIIYRQDGADFYDAFSGVHIKTVPNCVMNDYDVPGAELARERFHAELEMLGGQADEDVFCFNDMTQDVQDFIDFINSVYHEEGFEFGRQLSDAWDLQEPDFGLVQLEANAHLWKNGSTT